MMKQMTVAVVLFLWAANAMSQCALKQQIPLQNMHSSYGCAPQKPFAEGYLLFSNMQVIAVERNNNMPKAEHISAAGISVAALSKAENTRSLTSYPCGMMNAEQYCVATNSDTDGIFTTSRGYKTADNKINTIIFI